MKIARGILVLFAILFAMPAWAQNNKPVVNDKFGVTITPPAKWEVTQGSDKAVANFRHNASQSQIEVIGTRLMTKDVAKVFFETFHKTLKESQFEEKSKKEKTLGEHKGQETVYKFTHSGITLSVVIFQFTRGDSAWMIVGYMQDSDEAKFVSDVNKVVETMKFKGS